MSEAAKIRNWLLEALFDRTSEIVGPMAWAHDGAKHPAIVLKTGRGEWLISVERLE